MRAKPAEPRTFAGIRHTGALSKGGVLLQPAVPAIGVGEGDALLKVGIALGRCLCLKQQPRALRAQRQEQRSALEQEIRSNPEVEMAAWTSMGLRKAIRWREYGKTYSSSWLAKYTHGVDTLAEPGTGCCRRDASCLLASILNEVLPEGDISP